MRLFHLIISVVGLFFIVLLTWLNDPVTQHIRLDGARIRHYQQEQFFEVFVVFFQLVLLVGVFALACAVVVFALGAYRRYIDKEELDRDRHYKVALAEVQAYAVSQQPDFSGIHTLHYSPRETWTDTYSPHVTHHNKRGQLQESNVIDSDVPTIDLSPLEQTPLEQRPQPLPSFLETIQQCSDDNIILGYDVMSGLPKFGTVKGLYCAGVGGLTGSGKSTKATFILAQSVVNGAKIILIDPHAGDEQSLANRLAPLSASYMCPVASNDREVLDAIRLTQAIFNGRKNQTIPKDEIIIFVCDEWLSLMRGTLRDELTFLAQALTQEGRKYNMVAMFLSQNWTVAQSGDMRNSLASHILCRSRNDNARYQTGIPSQQLPKDLATLRPSEFYLFDTWGDRYKLRSPKVHQEELEQIALNLHNPTSPEKHSYSDLPKVFPVSSSDRNTRDTAPLQEDLDTSLEDIAEETQDTSQTVLTAEEEKVKVFLLEGKTAIEIAKSLSGKQSGRAYKEAHEKVALVVQKLIS